MVALFVLALVWQVKHFVADFPLQNTYMQKKFARVGWIAPLAAHCGVHAVMSLVLFAIAALLLGRVDLLGVAVLLAGIDGFSHFVIDRLKAHPDIGGKYTVAEKQFWNNLGLDQMAHHIVGLFLIFIFVYLQ